MFSSRQLIFSFFFTAALLFVTSRSSLAASELTAKEIVRKADQARMPDGDLSFVATVTDYKNRKQLRETRYQVYAKGQDLSLIDTVAPARQQGRKLLAQKDNLWFYTPDIKRPVRVSLQQRLTGEISNGDLARTNFAGDYNATIVGIEKSGDRDVYHLQLKANRKNVTYSAVSYWVAKDDFMPIRAEFFAISGKLLKKGTFALPKEVLGKTRLTKLFVQDALNPLNESIVIYTDHKRETLDDSFFNKDTIAQ